VEPIRLGVNNLLEGADPILSSYRDHRLSGDQAAAAIGKLEQSFATYMVDINALQPSNATLAGINAPYAHSTSIPGVAADDRSVSTVVAYSLLVSGTGGSRWTIGELLMIEVVVSPWARKRSRMLASSSMERRYNFR
jgi:hypothetical protein